MSSFMTANPVWQCQRSVASKRVVRITTTLTDMLNQAGFDPVELPIAWASCTGLNPALEAVAISVLR